MAVVVTCASVAFGPSFASSGAMRSRAAVRQPGESGSLEPRYGRTNSRNTPNSTSRIHGSVRQQRNASSRFSVRYAHVACSRSASKRAGLKSTEPCSFSSASRRCCAASSVRKLSMSNGMSLSLASRSAKSWKPWPGMLATSQRAARRFSASPASKRARKHSISGAFVPALATAARTAASDGSVADIGAA